MYIEIDYNSGFCYGVVNTINLAEKILRDGRPVYCIGAIVHNNREVERLKALGISFIDKEDLHEIHDSSVLIRTHGEPLSTYGLIKKTNNIGYDGTCPIVATLQKRVSKAAGEMNKVNGQVVLFGKKNHAEVKAIAGQSLVNLIVVGDLNDLDQIDYSRPVYLFSQTTQSVKDFRNIGEIIRQRMSIYFQKDNIPLNIKESICKHVTNRAETIKDFAKKFDCLIFISGQNSSNGKVLFEICKNNNKNSHWISKNEDIDKDWFTNSSSAGICGATSTPRWQLEEASKIIEQLVKVI
jgi:4-hydroxy-3-methylbut-2-enyl diphosphate reductase